MWDSRRPEKSEAFLLLKKGHRGYSTDLDLHYDSNNNRNAVPVVMKGH